MLEIWACSAFLKARNQTMPKINDKSFKQAAFNIFDKIEPYICYTDHENNLALYKKFGSSHLTIILYRGKQCPWKNFQFFLDSADLISPGQFLSLLCAKIPFRCTWGDHIKTQTVSKPTTSYKKNTQSGINRKSTHGHY